MAHLIWKTCTKLCQNRRRVVKDMTETFWCVFRFTVLTAVYLQNANAKFHKVARVETLFRWGKKRLHFCMTNLLRITRTKLYHNRSSFVDCISKNIWCVFFGSQCTSYNVDIKRIIVTKTSTVYQYIAIRQPITHRNTEKLVLGR